MVCMRWMDAAKRSTLAELPLGGRWQGAYEQADMGGVCGVWYVQPRE